MFIVFCRSGGLDHVLAFFKPFSKVIIHDFPVDRPRQCDQAQRADARRGAQHFGREAAAGGFKILRT